MTRRVLLAPLLPLALLAFAGGALAEDDKAACVAASTRGQNQRDEKKLAAAQKSFLACAKTSCPAVVRDACDGWAKEVEKLVPTVAFRAVGPDGSDLVDVAVKVDGVDVPTELLGTSQPIDPGPHKVLFRHKTHGTVEVALIAVEGEKNRVVRGELRGAAPPASAPRVTPPPPTSTAPPPPPPKTPEPPAARSGSALPYVALGVGVASLLGAGVFYLQHQSKNDDLSKVCDGDKRCPPSAQGTIDSANRAGVLAGVLGGVGLVFTAAGGYLLLAPQKTERAGFAPAVGFRRAF